MQEEEQSEVLSLLTKYGLLFALSDMDLGKTSMVRHTIMLRDRVPFKEFYKQIPPHQFEYVKKHLEEMLEIGAIRGSSSPWVSDVY